MPTIVIRRSGPADDDRLTPDPTPPPSVTASAPTIVAAPTEPPSPALARALEKMREVFRIKELRPGQAEIMESVLAGVVMTVVMALILDLLLVLTGRLLMPWTRRRA